MSARLSDETYFNTECEELRARVPRWWRVAWTMPERVGLALRLEWRLVALALWVAVIPLAFYL